MYYVVKGCNLLKKLQLGGNWSAEPVRFSHFYHGQRAFVAHSHTFGDKCSHAYMQVQLVLQDGDCTKVLGTFMDAWYATCAGLCNGLLHAARAHVHVGAFKLC